MTRQKLSDGLIDSLVCPEGKKGQLVFDATDPGFGVRVTAKGVKVFIYQYRHRAKIRRARIGVWGAGVTAAGARREATIMRARVLKGDDPAGDAAIERSYQKQVLSWQAEEAAARAFTFRAMVDQWVKTGLVDNKPSYKKDVERRLRRNLPSWQTQAVSEIKHLAAVQETDRINREISTVSARRVLSYARAAFNWAKARQLVAINPFEKMKAPGKEVSRDRVLSADEVGLLWRIFPSLEPVHTAYVQVLLLTLQRREEVAGMAWAELDKKLEKWTIPKERTKNGKEHLVHLSEPARAIIRGLPALDHNPHVFASGKKDGHVAAFSYMKKKLDDKIEAKRKSAPGLEAFEQGWRFHDFRRIGVTTMANRGVLPHVADKLLNHVTGSIQGVAAVYQRAQFIAEREKAIEDWATFVIESSRES